VNALRRDWRFWIGCAGLATLIATAMVGPFFVHAGATLPGYGPFSSPPAAGLYLGTDNVGRDLFAMNIVGLWPSILIGLVAATIGTAIGTAAGLTAGYRGGWVDWLVRLFSDVTLTVPAILVLAVVASFWQTTSVAATAIIIGIMSWAPPARAIRAQAASMRSSDYVRVARLNGFGPWRIVATELTPVITPYIIAHLVAAMNAGILASVALQLIGLGPLLTPNIGMILAGAFAGGAMIQGAWWWWAPPVITLAILFTATFLISLAFDQVTNPRLRKARA
jgi:peptide/nickel transport system permease protein